MKICRRKYWQCTSNISHHILYAKCFSIHEAKVKIQVLQECHQEAPVRLRNNTKHEKSFPVLSYLVFDNLPLRTDSAKSRVLALTQHILVLKDQFLFFSPPTIQRIFLFLLYNIIQERYSYTCLAGKSAYNDQVVHHFCVQRYHVFHYVLLQ